MTRNGNAVHPEVVGAIVAAGILPAAINKFGIAPNGKAATIGPKMKPTSKQFGGPWRVAASANC
ncbi:MAG: hypothetical protein FJ403_19805 [Verrucomicrobia bacterium]|nr:hypothetical protein [Verrucomicrobiota bacterium]